MDITCPACGDRGFIGDDLVCGSCHSRLEYTEPGRLEAEAEHVVCPGCQRRNPRGQARCESCGAQVQKACPVCRGLHPVGARVCARRGGALGEQRKRPSLVAAGFILGGLMLGGLGSWMGGQMRAHHEPIPVVANEDRPAIDAVFVIDTTGSMGDEIDVVKRQIKEMMAKVQSGQPRPYVRFGIVAYRDRGDEYVTKKFLLTDDVASIQTALDGLVADGGGDTPESVNEAMHVGVQEMNWNLDQKTRKVMFLIGDAGPHMDYPNDYDYRNECKVAKERGIKIHTWGCSGINECGEPEFKQIASLGGGDFQYLTYRQEVVKSDGSSGYVLFQGSRKCEAYGKTDWKKGVDKLDRSEVRAVDDAAVMAPSAGGGPVFNGPAMRAKPGAALENNLDRVLTEQVMSEAKAAGAKY